MGLGTVFSDCENYRYTLERNWVTHPTRYCMFLMLNPSTADEVKNDPTITRCADYAKRWGYEGLYVGNLYALRTPHPTVLWYRQRVPEDDIVGPENDMWLRKLARKSELIVAAWGTQAEPSRVKHVWTLLNLTRKTNLHYLKLCANGMPSHPLYLQKSLTPKIWSPK